MTEPITQTHNDGNTETIDLDREEFARAVLMGLTSEPMYLPSRFFYDDRGSVLFQKITFLEEYYLTGAEQEILDQKAKDILLHISGRDENIKLIELGAGDGHKTRTLISALEAKKHNFTYIPVDISSGAMETLQTAMKESHPGVVTHPITAEYDKALNYIRTNIKGRKFLLFLGSNLGNFTVEDARRFLSNVWHSLDDGDFLLLGLDLVKDPTVLISAYNDSGGITEEFNLNLLDRINRELDGDFRRDRFLHHPLYNPITQSMESYLVARESHDVYIGYLNRKFHFYSYEAIRTERSQKYTIETIHRLAQTTGYIVCEDFFDSGNRFVNTLWQVQKS